MRKEEILKRYDLLTLQGREIVDSLNDNWEERENLRKEYKTLTGNDIGHSETR